MSAVWKLFTVIKITWLSLFWLHSTLLGIAVYLLPVQTAGVTVSWGFYRFVEDSTCLLLVKGMQDHGGM